MEEESNANRILVIKWSGERQIGRPKKSWNGETLKEWEAVATVRYLAPRAAPDRHYEVQS